MRSLPSRPNECEEMELGRHISGDSASSVLIIHYPNTGSRRRVQIGSAEVTIRNATDFVSVVM